MATNRFADSHAILVSVWFLALSIACQDGADTGESRPEPEKPAGESPPAVTIEVTRDIHTQWDESWEKRDSVLAAVYEYGRGFGNFRGEVRQSLGEPREVSARAVENPDMMGTDSIVTWTYEGLRFVFYWVSFKESDFLITLEQTDSLRALPYEVVVGRTAGSFLLELLGEPSYTHTRNDTVGLRYPKPFFGAPEDIEFNILSDTLRSVKWLFYFD